MRSIQVLVVAHALIGVEGIHAEAPVASYLFPARGQLGQKVDVLVGGLFLQRTCQMEVVGDGIKAPQTIHRTTSPWFVGPLLPIPESQRAEDYPQTMAATFHIDRTAAVGNRFVRMWTSHGITQLLTFIVSDLPEIVEKEVDGSPIPLTVSTPVTINGRIFPREDIDTGRSASRKANTSPLRSKPRHSGYRFKRCSRFGTLHSAASLKVIHPAWAIRP